MNCQPNLGPSSRTSAKQRRNQATPSQVPKTSQHATQGRRKEAEARKKSSEPNQKEPATHKRGQLQRTSLKRRRSVAQGLALDNTDSEDAEFTAKRVPEKLLTFYIGDIDAFKEFLTHRFDELTMKPLRGIATNWVKLIEPRQRGDWGKYHEMKPSEAETPPWWPQDVIYKEPSHLKKEDLTTLAVEMMLVHRKIDDIKRKGPWISKLRDVAKFTAQTTSDDHFSSSKGAAHSEEMKKRALEEILPSIFGVAQAYEDHILHYNLIEGSGYKDPGGGRRHTWKPIPRPVIRQQPKRPRRTAHSERVQKTFHEASGDETEPDDTMTKLHLGEENLDMKPHVRTMSGHGGMQPPYNMPSYTQRLQYPTTPTSSNGQAYQSANNYANQASAFPHNALTFVNPFTMFNAPAPPLSYDQYTSPMPEFPYGQDIFPPTPMSYANNMPITFSGNSMPYFGLPTNYLVASQAVHV